MKLHLKNLHTEKGFDDSTGFFWMSGFIVEADNVELFGFTGIELGFCFSEPLLTILTHSPDRQYWKIKF